MKALSILLQVYRYHPLLPFSGDFSSDIRFRFRCHFRHPGSLLVATCGFPLHGRVTTRARLAPFSLSSLAFFFFSFFQRSLPAFLYPRFVLSKDYYTCTRRFLFLSLSLSLFFSEGSPYGSNQVAFNRSNSNRLINRLAFHHRDQETITVNRVHLASDCTDSQLDALMLDECSRAKDRERE